MRDALSSILLVIGFCTCCLVLLLAAAGFGQISGASQTEIDFRAACDAVKGTSVWNGRNWSCLK